MTTMQNAARFFDLHSKALKEGAKLDSRVSRQGDSLEAKARKALERRKSKGSPIRIAEKLDDAKQRKALVAIAQELHKNNDKPSVDLKHYITNALKMPEIDQKHMAQIKVLVNDFRKVAGEKEVQVLNKEGQTKDIDIWGEAADDLAEIKKTRFQKFEESTTGKTLLDGLSSALGPAGMLIKLGLDLKKAFGSDAKQFWDRMQSWRKTEKDGNKKLKKASKDKSKRFGIAMSRFGTMFRNLFSKIKNVASLTASTVMKGGKSLLGMVGRHKGKLGLAAVAGLGLYGASHFGSSDDEPEQTPEATSVVSPIPDDTSTGSTPPVVDATVSQPAAQIKMPDATAKEDHSADEKKQAASATPKEIAKTIQPITDNIGGLFIGITSFMGDKWDSFCGKQLGSVEELSKKFDAAKLKINITQDKLEESRDQIFDSIQDSFSDSWKAIKSFLPDSVNNGIIRATAVVSNIYNGVKDTLGGDGTANPQSVTMPATQGSSDGSAITKAGNVDIEGLNGSVKNNLYAMADEYYKATGKKIKVNSAKRDSKEQAALYQQNPAKAAKPGYSMHEFGYAIDITDADGTATKLDKMGLLSKYGFTRPLLNASFPEPWHVEPIAIQGMKAAIRSGKAKMEEQTASSTTPDSKTDTEGAASSTSTTADAKVNAQAAASAVKQADNTVSGGNAASLAKAVTPPSQAVAPTASQAASIGGGASATSSPTTAATSSAGNNGNDVSSVVSSSSRAMSATMTSTAPSVDSYSQVASVSDVIDANVTQPQAEVTPTASSSSRGGGVSIDTVPLYLGDYGMLMLNFGMTGK